MAGRRPVEEAFAAKREVRRMLVVPERRTALEALVLHATALRVPVVEVEGGTLTSLCGFDGHQGVALVVAPRRWATLDEIIARARERGQPPFVLVLDSLEDPQNVGTLLRTAEACGIHGVLFPTRRSAPMSPAAIKASAGAIEHLLLCPTEDLAAALADLRGVGLRLIGADEDAPLPYRESDLRGPLALVVGSEAHGLSGAVRRRLDGAVRLPMRGRVASLNAAVAGSVLLFEAASQREGVAGPAEPAVVPADRTENEATVAVPGRLTDDEIAAEPGNAATAAEPGNAATAAKPDEDELLPGKHPIPCDGQPAAGHGRRAAPRRSAQ
ncbi:hypothetical protein BH24CHL8_BH24CHL8_07550 [soil metagenome]